jgi:transposase
MPGKPSMDRPACRALTASGAPCRKRAAAGSAFCGVHGGQRRPIGRPGKLTHELVERIAYAVERGVTWEVAAQVAGVHEATLIEWRKRGEQEHDEGRDTVYADLHEELTRARAAAEVALVDVVRRHTVTDWRAAAWLLERSRPDRWASTAKLTVDDKRVEPRTITPDDPDRRASIIDLLATATAPPAPAPGD